MPDLAPFTGKRNPAASAQEIPNDAQKFIGSILEDVPFLQTAFLHLGRPLFAVANVADAAFQAAQGNGDEALQSVRSAGANTLQFFTGLIPGIPTVAGQEDVKTFDDVLRRAGFPEGPRFEVPLIGNVTARGTAGFFIDIPADPLVSGRLKLGQLTKAGVAAKKTGVLAKGASRIGTEFGQLGVAGGGRLRDIPFVRSIPVGLQKTLKRSGSSLAAQAEAGQRALIQLYGRPIWRGTKTLEAIDNIRRSLKASPIGRAFNKVANTDVAASASAAQRQGGIIPIKTTRAAQEWWEESAKEAVRLGFDEDQLAIIVNLATEKKTINGVKIKLRRFGEVWDRVRKTMKDFDLSAKEAVRATRVVDFVGADPAMAPIVGQHIKFFNELFMTEADAGVAIARFLSKDAYYAFHNLTEEAKAVFNKNPAARAEFGEFFKGFMAKAGPEKQRRVLRGLSIPEVNSRVRQLFPDFEGNFFNPSPLINVVERSKRTGFSVTGADFTRRVGSDYGEIFTPVKEAAGWKSLDNIMQENGLTPFRTNNGGNVSEIIGVRMGKLIEEGVSEVDAAGIAKQQLVQEGLIVPTKLAGLEDLWIPPDIVADVTNTLRTWQDPFTASKVMGIFDETQKFWKAGVTVPFSEFHMRNARSGIWANFIAGLKNPVDHIRGLALATKVRLARRFPDKFGHLWDEAIDLGPNSQVGSMTLRDLMDEAQAGQALGFGQFSKEEFVTLGTDKSLLGLAKHLGVQAIKGKPGETVAKRAVAGLPRALIAGPRVAIEGGRRAGSFVEDAGRLALFVERLRAGHSIDTAILDIKRFHFNYADLTSFEKAVFKRIAPFYAWVRKNMPLQLEHLVTRPGDASLLASFQRWIQSSARDDQGRIDTSLVPEYVKRRLFGMSRDPDTDEVQIFSGFGFGFEDIGGFFDHPAQEFLGMLSPALKAPLQSATGRDFFKGAPLERTEIVPSYFRFFKFIPGGQAMLDEFGFRMVKNRRGEEIYARMDPEVVNALQVIPLRLPQTISRFGDKRTSSPEPVERTIFGMSRQTFNKRDQMRQHQIALTKKYVSWLEEKVRLGEVGKFTVFSSRRGIPLTQKRQLAIYRKKLGRARRLATRLGG